MRVALGVVSLPRSGHFGGDMTNRLFNNYTIYWGGDNGKVHKILHANLCTFPAPVFCLVHLFFPVRTGSAVASVRQQRPQQAAAQGPEKRRQARPPCDAGAPPQHSPAAPRRPPGRVRARRLTGTGGWCVGQGEQPPHRRLRGTGREHRPAAAGCAAAA